MHKADTIPPQIRAIIDFRNEIILRTGRKIALSEAIAIWIALGNAEQYRKDYFKQYE